MRVKSTGYYVIAGLIAGGLFGCSAEDPAFTQSTGTDLEGNAGPIVDPAAELGTGRSSGDARAESSRTVPDPEVLFGENDSPPGTGPGKRNESGDPGTLATRGSEAEDDGIETDERDNEGALVEAGASDSDGAGGGSTGSAMDDELSNSPGSAVSGTNTSGAGSGLSSLGTSSAAGGSQRVQRSFSISTVREAQGQIVVEDRWTSQPVTMQVHTDARTQNFNQISRPALSRNFTQGAAGVSYVETLAQRSAAGVLDLLVVVDNSGSMEEEQSNLASKLSPLLSYVSESDWRIGVVTTDPGDGCMRALINKGSPEASSAFSAAISAGIGGSGNERGIFQAVTGISCPGTPWLRESSTVAVLIVSDEDNCSDGLGCNDDPWNHPDYLLNFLQNDLGKELGVDARVYGLIKHPGDKSCKTAYRDGTQYAQAVAASNGTWGSICARDYSSTLSSISRDVSTILKDQFALQVVPDPATVAITLILENGTRVPATNFMVTGNVITFFSAPPENSNIEVSYTTYDEPQLAQFDLGASPAPNSVSVMVNGVQLEASAYAVLGNQLVFAAPPTPEASIEVNFLRNDPLNRTFSVGTGVLPNTLQVLVNGQVVTDYTYNATGGTLKFNQAPADGALISAQFQAITGPMLSYDFSTSGATITDIRAQYADNTPVEITYSNGRFSLVQASDHRSGATLWVQYRVSSEAASYALPQEPLPGTLILNSSLEDCRVGEEITVLDSQVFVNCPSQGELTLTYSYSFNVAAQRTFTFPEAALINAGQWTVSIDGDEQAPELFTLNGNTVTLSSSVPLTEGSVVHITYSSEVM